MKRFLLVLFLLVSAAPLFATDEGGDIAYIPSYRELVREGYGPHEYDYIRPAMRVAPKPTQAYYGKGYTVYYGYTAVPVRQIDGNILYAFGYPVEFFSHMIPMSDSGVNLGRCALAVSNRYGVYGPGDAIAQHRTNRANATSTVQSTTTNTAPANGAAPLPAIGEKPAH